MIHLGEGLLGREHGDRRHRDQPVRVRAEGLGHVGVERAGEGPAQLVVGEGGDGEAVGGIEDRNVDPDLVEALVKQLGHHRGGAVGRVAGGKPPPGCAGDAHLAAQLGGHPPNGGGTVDHLVEAGGHVVARDVDDEVANPWEELDDVTVGVDHRMIQLRPDPGDLGGRSDAHGSCGVAVVRSRVWTRTGSSNPFSIRRPAGSVSTDGSAATASSTRTSPGTAESTRRAARFTTGPK